MTASGLPDGGWVRALTAPERRRRAQEPPEWVSQFTSAYARPVTAFAENRGLLNAVLPLMETARSSVRRAVAASGLAASDLEPRDRLIESLESHLFRQLFAAASKVLVLELAVAREHGLLLGDTPQQRYAFFCDCLTDRPFAVKLLAQYPLLVRRITGLVARWEVSTRELLERGSNDLPRIRSALFDDEDPGLLTGVLPLGDPHLGGHCVHRLDFASGRSVIYKPRSVAMEHGVFALVRWMNDSGYSPQLGAIVALDCGLYGWTQFARAVPCVTEAGVHRYFVRQGANLGIAYLLGASDLHFENVIAAGEYPLIVDLETLFHDPTRIENLGPASTAAYRTIGDSVTRTLLLPARIESRVGDGSGRTDISALGYVAGQQAPLVAHEWADWGTDTMHMAARRGALPAGGCIPQLGSQAASASDHVDDITSGFTDAYELFRRKKGVLLDAAHGPLRIFQGRMTRRVFRETATYLLVLAQSWHPGQCVDAKTMKTLIATWLPPPDVQKRLRAVISRTEMTDLMNADVPYFCARVGGRYSGSQGAAIRVVGSAGWKAARDRLNGLSVRDKERQIWITRLSFVRFDRELPKSSWVRKRATRPVIVDAARAIGDRLCELAIVKNERASWLFPMLDDTIHLVPAICGLDLYDGLSGVALFLGALHVQTGTKRYRRMAEAAVAEALGIFRRAQGISPGGYEGAGGFAYALALLGTWLDRPDWCAKAASVIRRTAGDAARNGASDLISGQAGFLICGIAVGKATDRADILNCVRPCAEDLLALTTDRLPADADAGLAHGKAGIGLALARWAEATGSKDIRKRATKLFVRDLASTLSTDLKRTQAPGNVLDGREMIAWCRGGVGTALAALCLGLDAKGAYEAVVSATATRLSRNTSDNCLCLCHGLFGVLEFLNKAAGRDIKGARAIAKLVREEAVSRVLAGEFCSDSAHRLDAPGLMKGMAGTGYALLRLLEPRTVPSVLTLECG